MVETYSFDAIKLLDDRNGEGEGFKEFVAEIWKMQGKFQLYMLKHIHRETDKLVDFIGKHGLSL